MVALKNSQSILQTYVLWKECHVSLKGTVQPVAYLTCKVGLTRPEWNQVRPHSPFSPPLSLVFFCTFCITGWLIFFKISSQIAQILIWAHPPSVHVWRESTVSSGGAVCLLKALLARFDGCSADFTGIGRPNFQPWIAQFQWTDILSHGDLGETHRTLGSLIKVWWLKLRPLNGKGRTLRHTSLTVTSIDFDGIVMEMSDIHNDVHTGYN